MLIYQDSNDTKVFSAGIKVRIRGKWRAQEGVDQAESQLQHRVMVEAVAPGWAEFGRNLDFTMTRTGGKKDTSLIRRPAGPYKHGLGSLLQQDSPDVAAGGMGSMRVDDGWRILWSELWKDEP